jgi:hypothetical protein
MLLVEFRGEPGTDRPAGEENPHLVARCPNPACPTHRGQGDGAGEPAPAG